MNFFTHIEWIINYKQISWIFLLHEWENVKIKLLFQQLRNNDFIFISDEKCPVLKMKISTNSTENPRHTITPPHPTQTYLSSSSIFDNSFFPHPFLWNKLSVFYVPCHEHLFYVWFFLIMQNYCVTKQERFWEYNRFSFFFSLFCFQYFFLISKITWNEDSWGKFYKQDVTHNIVIDLSKDSVSYKN